jgi:hypothetical protein
VIGLSFLMFGRLCHMCVSCVKCMLSIFFMAWSCFLYWTLNVRPVCLMYLSGHSMHFNWHTPLWSYAVNNLINQINAHPITHEDKDQELKTIREILENNDYQQQTIHAKQKHKIPTNDSQETQKSKWVTFTYYGPDKRKITKIFKNSNITIALKTSNTIRNHLKPGEKNNSLT